MEHDDGPGVRDRPETEASYGIPTDREGAVPWSFVKERLADQRSYLFQRKSPVP